MRILVIISVLSLFTCKPEEKPYNKSMIIQETSQMLHDYLNDVKINGLEAELKYLYNSSEFFWVPPGYNKPISYDSVAHFVRVNAPKFDKINNSIDTIKIIPLSNEHAIYTMIINSAITDTLGKTSLSKLIETGNLIKKKGGWKLYNGQTAVIE